MKRIVERCPSCGVEHDHEVHECEACGSAVRYWCRTHSRQIGWLAGPACLHCDEDAALPAPTLARPRATGPAPAPTPSRARAAWRPPERPRVASVSSVLIADGGPHVRPSRPRGWREPAALEPAHVFVEREIAIGLRTALRIIIVPMILFLTLSVYHARPYENIFVLVFNVVVGGSMMGLILVPFVVIARYSVRCAIRWWRERSDG
jgi:hypothetical protein